MINDDLHLKDNWVVEFEVGNISTFENNLTSVVLLAGLLVKHNFAVKTYVRSD